MAYYGFDADRRLVSVRNSTGPLGVMETPTAPPSDGGPWFWNGTRWAEELPAPAVSPLQFKMSFTSAERLAGKELAQTDSVVADFFSLIEDQRLTEVDLSLQSVREAVAYLFDKLVQMGVVEEADREARVAQVLSGILQ